MLDNAIRAGLEPSQSPPFDVIAAYRRNLLDEDTSMPIAAVLALTELLAVSKAETMYELVEALKVGAAILKQATPNPISLTAGCDLFIRYVSTARQEDLAFATHKEALIREGNLYARNAAESCREKISHLALGFIPDDGVILIHSFSRVVLQALINAHKRKRVSVYVTEARPRGLGIKAFDALTAAGVPSTLVLDSAVAYVMDRVDLVLVGSEAVVESGGLINAVGSYQVAIIAKAANKPLYALAESYKFLRSFPLSQYDLPIHNSSVLRLPTQKPSHPSTLTVSHGSPAVYAPPAAERPAAPHLSDHSSPAPTLTMTPEQLANNPDVDYTRPDLIALVFSDVGILTPSGVSQYLVNIFSD
ncbi:uncharacterized protein EI90DRAFT_2930077 [Cantharellus anzutake]|uniref:uncharacterized protein n=1 Tax=Cantharellus anzutake TaxID=1750568 RepID=UPI001904C776|nr:uncharacterized protein EI90DRAFT_2941713 [Cantharellus anzutake]XP_038912847.1 uncharacterized protein EI90DRAFT_2930077 [Cantharellus anzutake]KAF8318627.1 hypothetical protein EI90DRAFT_2941713 [Cantharellus anzutake]KAF8326339.1 hypothetical protein EI90DRAFT_2930077 [Cantharellus anzutake]